MIKNQNHLGALCMILSVLFFSFMDCLIKLTATDFAVGQVMFSRALFGLIPIFFLIPKKRFKDFYKTKHVSLHFHRSFWGAIAMYAIFVGIRNLGLAEVTSMAFSGPIWVVIFSILFLGERIRAKRWIAVGLGFIGVLIIGSLESGVVALGLSGFYVQFINGLMITAAVTIYALIQRRKS